MDFSHLFCGPRILAEHGTSPLSRVEEGCPWEGPGGATRSPEAPPATPEVHGASAASLLAARHRRGSLGNRSPSHGNASGQGPRHPSLKAVFIFKPLLPKCQLRLFF